ncbi:phosphoserine phosphatase SerB [Helicobacter suis]|uniref:Phosphoserine phosphatase n=1 Tax=Helicobacter suis TaxID=104628 RepID=A0ABM7L0C3_9HELI|nr:phosphoserine phosphatase SerB [Helicobacter suis]BCD46138.1 Phosphoserine phosphatase SerB [Helicobacter suis]GFK16754.1 Phosphoserine phosphatase SerB [Helicobacter suis]
MKLAVFDFDSTLIKAETLEVLTQAYKADAEIKEITQKAMEGKMDFYESLMHRVACLKGMDFKEAKNICENLPLQQGAYEVVLGLQARGYKVVCFSGGFTLATSFFKEKLKLDGDFSNTLHVEKGVLNGQVSGPMMRGDSKFELLQSLQGLLGVKQTLVVGDGANDIGMFALADVSIAFNAKEIVKKAAKIVAQTTDLREILEYV